MNNEEKKLFAALTPAVVTSPVLRKLEDNHLSASQSLRSALQKVELDFPGFQYDLMMEILDNVHLSVNMCETLLRLQSDASINDYRITRQEPGFRDLQQRAILLKKILGRIPDEIYNRKDFLETIKDIASAIKHLLDAVNAVMPHVPTQRDMQVLEQKKREFVKYSKRFSNTLKDFFKDNREMEVFMSANYLVHQTNVILKTVQNIT